MSGTYADGERLRWTPQAYYSIGSVGVLAELVNVSQEVSRSTPSAGLRAPAANAANVNLLNVSYHPLTS